MKIYLSVFHDKWQMTERQQLIFISVTFRLFWRMRGSKCDQWHNRWFYIRLYINVIFYYRHSSTLQQHSTIYAFYYLLKLPENIITHQTTVNLFHRLGWSSEWFWCFVTRLSLGYDALKRLWYLPAQARHLVERSGNYSIL